MTVTLSGDQGEQVVNSHGDPLMTGTTDAVTLMDDEPDQSVIVVCFNMGLLYPHRQVRPGGIFAFDHRALSMNADTADIATISRPRFRSAINPIVIQGVGEIIGDFPLEGRTRLAGRPP